MEGIENEQDSVSQRDGQDIIGLEDPILSPPSVEEIPLGQEDSRQEIEQEPYQMEPSDEDLREYAQEVRQRVSLWDTLDAISGHRS